MGTPHDMASHSDAERPTPPPRRQRRTPQQKRVQGEQSAWAEDNTMTSPDPIDNVGCSSMPYDETTQPSGGTVHGPIGQDRPTSHSATPAVANIAWMNGVTSPALQTLLTRSRSTSPIDTSVVDTKLTPTVNPTSTATLQNVTSPEVTTHTLSEQAGSMNTNKVLTFTAHQGARPKEIATPSLVVGTQRVTFPDATPQEPASSRTVNYVLVPRQESSPEPQSGVNGFDRAQMEEFMTYCDTLLRNESKRVPTDSQNDMTPPPEHSSTVTSPDMVSCQQTFHTPEHDGEGLDTEAAFRAYHAELAQKAHPADRHTVTEYTTGLQHALRSIF